MESLGQLLALFFFIYLMYQTMKYVFKMLFGFHMAKQQVANTSNGIVNNIVTNIMLRPFKGVINILLGQSEPNKMMTNSDINKFLNSFNKGLVLDGQNKRLSEKDSFNHIAIISGTGGGKTSAYIIPNILKLASGKCSMIVTDLSGELYERTSGYLKQKGFNILVLDPEKLSESSFYNPLYYADTPTKASKLVELLVSSANPLGVDPKNKFFIDQAKTLLYVLIRVLINTGEYRYINLANVRHILNNFGENGSVLDDFIFIYTGEDEQLFGEWMGLRNMREDLLKDIVATAKATLYSIGINENLALLTANHTINFEIFREKKTILYIRIPEQDQEDYAFLLNIFYTQFFNTIMRNLPSKKDLPIHCLLDEFGNMKIPRFTKIATGIRKYKVSLSAVLQDFHQLEKQYGKEDSKTIISGGLTGMLFFAGADNSITKVIAENIGKQYKERVDTSGKMHSLNEYVLSPDEIRTMDDNEVLFLYRNKKAMKFKTKPYYKDFIFNSHTKIKPYRITNHQQFSNIEYVNPKDYIVEDVKEE